VKTPYQLAEDISNHCSELAATFGDMSAQKLLHTINPHRPDWPTIEKNLRHLHIAWDRLINADFEGSEAALAHITW